MLRLWEVWDEAGIRGIGLRVVAALEGRCWDVESNAEPAARVGRRNGASVVGGTKVSADSQGTPTQLHQHQVWVFRCQISQILRKETQKQSAGGGCDAKSNARVPTARSSILKAGEDLSGCKEHSHKSWMLWALHLTCPAEMDPSALSFPYL